MYFSIIIPVYNGSEFVAEAIESVLKQEAIDSAEYEIIVVNDGSNDDGRTYDAVRPYLDSVRYIEKKNGGVSSALNVGIEQANGKYICWLSHDDLFFPNKLAKQKAIIESFSSNKDFIFFARHGFINAKGEEIWKRRNTVSNREGVRVLLADEMLSILLNKNFLAGCTVAVPRSAFKEAVVEKFDESLRYIQDAEMWIRLSLAGFTFVVDDAVVVWSRVHADQQTGKRLDRWLYETRALNRRLVKDTRFYSKLSGGAFVGEFYKRLSSTYDFGLAFRDKSLRDLLRRNGKYLFCLSVFFVGLLRAALKYCYRKVVSFAYQ